MMRKFIACIVLVPALVPLVIGLLMLLLAFGVAGGTKGISALGEAIQEFADNLKG